MLPVNKLPANKPPSNSHFSFKLKIIKFMHELLISVTGHWKILEYTGKVKGCDQMCTLRHCSIYSQLPLQS